MFENIFQGITDLFNHVPLPGSARPVFPVFTMLSGFLGDLFAGI